jgi:hypothetical protein
MTPRCCWWECGVGDWFRPWQGWRRELPPLIFIVLFYAVAYLLHIP